VAVVTFVATLKTNAGSPQFQSEPVLIPSIAGLAALFATLVLENTLAFVWHLTRAPALVRAKDEEARQASIIALGTDGSIKQWLRATLSNPKLGVIFAAAFGGLVAMYPTRDVDVLVQLGDAIDHTLRKRVLAIKRLSIHFEDAYHMPLHVQFFSFAEADALREFVKRAGAIEVLIGEEH
jgi:hypothetical protein